MSFGQAKKMTLKSNGSTPLFDEKLPFLGQISMHGRKDHGGHAVEETRKDGYVERQINSSTDRLSDRVSVTNTHTV